MASDGSPIHNMLNVGSCSGTSAAGTGSAPPPSSDLGTAVVPCFWALVSADSNLSFLFVPAAVIMPPAVDALLRCIHPNDVLSVVKELAQFIDTAKTGSSETLAGCSVRCRFSLVDRSCQPTSTRPFIPHEVFFDGPSSVVQWTDVEIGFNIVGRDCLLAFVHNRETLQSDPAISPQDIAALQAIMQKKHDQESQQALPNMFLTIVDPNSDRVLYTSSLIKLSAMRQLQSNPTTTTGTTSSTSSTTTTTATTTTATPEINNLEFFKTHLSQDAINLFNLKSTSNSATSLLQTFKIFSFKHTVASSSLNDSEYHSLFIRSTDVLFVISRVPTIMGASDKILVPISNALTDRVAEESASLVDVAPLSASLSPPMSDASNEHGKSPIIGKRAFRPWEADELSAEKLVPPTLRQPQQERLKIPSISTILPPYHQMQDHKYRGMSASPLYQSRGEDPMSPLLAAVQRVATQSSPLHQFNSKPQYSNNPYSVNYKLPQSQQPPQHLQQPQQAHFIFPTPASTPKVYHITQQSTAPTSAPPRVQVQLPPSNYQQQQYQSNQYNESRLSSSQSPSTNPNHYVSSISTTGTAPSTESAPSMSSTTATASISSKAPNFHIQKTSSVPPSSESSLSPSHRQQQQQPHQLQTLQEEEFSVSKSRPLKPGHCKKCGTTASREWRKGPHGLKTLCNACGLRYKRKPWDIVNTFSTPSQLSAASGALTVGSGEGEGDQHSSDGGGYEVLQQRAKYSPGSSGVGVE